LPLGFLAGGAVGVAGVGVGAGRGEPTRLNPPPYFSKASWGVRKAKELMAGWVGFMYLGMA